MNAAGRIRFFSTPIVFPIAACLSLILPASAQSDPLTLSYSVPLPGVKGRFDHFAISPDSTRLAVAALGNNTVEVIDLALTKHLLSVTGQHKPCGVLFSKDGATIFEANGGDGTFKIIDAKTGGGKASLPRLDDADNSRKDAEHFFVGYGNGGLAAINIADGKLSHHFPLKAHPESSQLEVSGSRIFVNVPDARQIAVTDRSKMAVVVIAVWLGRFQSQLGAIALPSLPGQTEPRGPGTYAFHHEAGRV